VADAAQVASRRVGEEDVGPQVDGLRRPLEASPEAGKRSKVPFRDAFGLEFYVRKLAKHGVNLVSITQELGDDPAHTCWNKPKWWAVRGSNPRHPRCKRGALPLS
jgi:hypothetical protein